MSSNSKRLADALIKAGAVPRTKRYDADHIAIAVVEGVGLLLSWNFKHIVNEAIRDRIERVCRQMGYGDLYAE